MLTTLFKPVNPNELEEIEKEGLTLFPKNLYKDFFYPVVTELYAIKIAKEFIIPEYNKAVIIKFEIDTSFLKNYNIKSVGSLFNKEYWIPEKDMDEFNKNIGGKFVITKEYN